MSNDRSGSAMEEEYWTPVQLLAWVMFRDATILDDVTRLAEPARTLELSVTRTYRDRECSILSFPVATDDHGDFGVAKLKVYAVLHAQKLLKVLLRV